MLPNAKEAVFRITADASIMSDRVENMRNCMYYLLKVMLLSRDVDLIWPEVFDFQEKGETRCSTGVGDDIWTKSVTSFQDRKLQRQPWREVFFTNEDIDIPLSGAVPEYSQLAYETVARHRECINELKILNSETTAN